MQAIVSDEVFNAATEAAKREGRSTSNWLGWLVHKELQRAPGFPRQPNATDADPNSPTWQEEIKRQQAELERDAANHRQARNMDAELAGSRAVRSVPKPGRSRK